MINRILTEEKADMCDKLLTKLIKDEKKYDDSIEDPLIVIDYFKNIIKNDKNILLGYEIDNTIVGYIFLKPEDNNAYLIDGLFVEENHRNKKIATKLLEEALKTLKEMKIKYVDINVLKKNAIAFNLYKSFDFEEFKLNMRKEI